MDSLSGDSGMSAEGSCPMRGLPAKPPLMPPNPSLLKRLTYGLRSSLSLIQAGAFASGGAGRHVVPQIPDGKRSLLYTVREPALIREILVERPEDFPKSRLMRHMLGDLIGASVFVENGESWRWRRAIVSQALAQARVRDVLELMRDATDALIDRLETGIGDQREAVLRVDTEITHFAADVIFRTLFSEPIGGADAKRIIRAFERYQRVAYAHGMLRLARIPVNLLPSALRRRRAASEIRAVLAKPLRRRLAAIAAGAPTPDNDILAGLIAYSDPETGRRFGEAELLNEAAMLFLAGHETSASALGWSLYLLSITPQVQADTHEEAVRVLGERAPEFGDMKALNLARNVFREALRLYPPVAQIARDTERPEAICEHAASPGEVVFAPAWVMHRQPRFWRDPDSFDPDRFDTEEGRAASRDAYFPFSMGPRICPGAAFALQEATQALGMLARRFVFEPAPGREPAWPKRQASGTQAMAPAPVAPTPTRHDADACAWASGADEGGRSLERARHQVGPATAGDPLCRGRRQPSSPCGHAVCGDILDPTEASRTTDRHTGGARGAGAASPSASAAETQVQAQGRSSERATTH
jgi:cytochrome P450